MISPVKKYSNQFLQDAKVHYQTTHTAGKRDFTALQKKIDAEIKQLVNRKMSNQSVNL